MILGKTWEQKYWEREREMKKKTGPWFAWRPVILVDGRLVWLSTVFRRLYRDGTSSYFPN